MKHNIFSIICIVFSVIGLIALHICMISISGIPLGMYISLLIFYLIILALGIISDMVWLKEDTYFYSKKINKIYKSKANNKETCDNFKFTFPSKESIRIECNENIGLFSCEIGGMGIDVFASDMNWVKHIGPLQEDEKLQFIKSIHQYSILHRNKIICFYNNQYNLIKFKWDGTPLAVMKGENIEIIETECICKALENIVFDSVDDFEKFQNYICYLLYIKELEEARVLLFQRKIRARVERFKCPECKSIWVLEYPGSSSNGSWENTNETR